jgi:hypothetical protein
MDMDLTQKITRDINQFKSVPSSQAPANASTPSTSPAGTSSFDLSSIFNVYTLGIVSVIILMFSAWFAWDWYKTQKLIKGDDKKGDDSKTTPTQNEPTGEASPENAAIQEKCKNDQKALETALSASNKGGEPMATDLAEGTGKAGWCYIGEDQGYGVCASVQKNDKCMSGKVFPTESECRQK